MTTLKRVKYFAKKLGAKVEDQRDGYAHRCGIEAPHRFIWCEGGVHELVDETNQPWKPDYAHLIKRMSYGIEPCTDPDCDWCNPLTPTTESSNGNQHHAHGRRDR
jgi:hypothetical protein